MSKKSVKILLKEFPNFIPIFKAKTKHQWKIKDEISEKLLKNISVAQKKINGSDYYLYNYNRTVFVNRNHSLIVKCRGLILDSKGTIFNYPFDRFFNEFENESADIDWNSAKILEKLDGSLICIWHIESVGWQITTRGAFYPLENKNSVDYEFLFENLFTKFYLLDSNYNYMFELITKLNPIVKKYSSEFVALIGMRNRHTLKESNQMELDFIAKKLGVKRPKYFSANNLIQVKGLFKSMKEDDEGLVIIDKKFNRIKIKQESYIRLGKIKNLSDKDIFDHVIGKSSVDVEFLVKEVDVMNKITVFKDHILFINKKVTDIYIEIDKMTNNRKEFSQEALKHSYSSLLFQLYDKNPLIDKLNWLSYNKIISELIHSKIDRNQQKLI